MPACQQPLAPQVPVTPWWYTLPRPKLHTDPLDMSKRSERVYERTEADGGRNYPETDKLRKGRERERETRAKRAPLSAK